MKKITKKLLEIKKITEIKEKTKSWRNPPKRTKNEDKKEKDKAKDHAKYSILK